MTPKEKSEELFVKFYPNWYDNGLVVKRKYAKQCALICVDEILKASTIKLSPSGNVGKFVYIDEYWQQVKTEIEKL